MGILAFDLFFFIQSERRFHNQINGNVFLIKCKFTITGFPCNIKIGIMYISRNRDDRVSQ